MGPWPRPTLAATWLSPEERLRHVSEAGAPRAGRGKGEGGKGFVGAHLNVVTGSLTFCEFLVRTVLLVGCWMLVCWYVEVVGCLLGFVGWLRILGG